MEKKKTDFNSNVNQNIKQKFVGQHIYCNVSMMLQELQELNQLDSERGVNIFDHVTPYGIFEDAEIDETEVNEKIDEIQDKISELEEIADYYGDKSLEFCSEDAGNNYDILEEKGNNLILKLEDKITELEEMEFDQYPEILEYYTVSDFLANKLKENNHIIIDVYYCKIWGRGTSGQAILLDNVISEICNDMQILEGQSYSWAKKED